MLDETTAPSDPFVLFGAWFAEAEATVRSPEAMALATASASGAPSVRMVLMKHWDEQGLVFYTNYGSRKGRELVENPRGALVLHWDPIGRQVRLEGTIDRVTDGESDRYFAARPRGAQIGARASRQSSPISDRGSLDRHVRAVTDRYVGKAVPRPPWWGGYRLRPVTFEFWQHRDDRLHDRICYRRGANRWDVVRLQP